MARLEMDNKQEYVILLDLLARVIHASEGFSISDISDGERLWDADGLAKKFFTHALTVLYLSHRTKQELPSFKFSFTDLASIDVLTRAALDAFLTFHYVFFAPAATEEKDYRYWSYKAAGLAERQNLPVTTSEHKQKIAEEKKKLDEVQDKLELNKVFQSLEDNQKRQIFKGKGEWKWKPHGRGRVSWREIAIDAGFSEMLASHMYRHLSGYVHSSSLSVLQINQAYENKEENRLIEASIGTINIVAANLIREYCGLFPWAQDVLSKDPEGNDIVEVWIQIGRGLDKYMGIGQGND